MLKRLFNFKQINSTFASVKLKFKTMHVMVQMYCFTATTCAETEKTSVRLGQEDAL